MLITAYLINSMPTLTTNFKSPYQLLYQQNPDYSHLRIYGCAYYLLPPHNRHKLQPRTTPCIFLGYSPNSKGCKCFVPSIGRIIISWHIVFDESHFLSYNPSSLPSTQNTPHTPQQIPPLLLNTNQQLLRPTPTFIQHPSQPASITHIPVQLSTPSFTSQHRLHFTSTQPLQHTHYTAL